jgi:hypothetical protein
MQIRENNTRNEIRKTAAWNATFLVHKTSPAISELVLSVVLELSMSVHDASATDG